MPFLTYKSTLLDRMQNSPVIDGLISYILKPRENNCTLSLWVAERVAERRLQRLSRLTLDATPGLHIRRSRRILLADPWLERAMFAVPRR